MYYFLPIPLIPCPIALSKVAPLPPSCVVEPIHYPLRLGSCPEVSLSKAQGRVSAPRTAQDPPSLHFREFFLSVKTFRVGIERKKEKEKAGRQPGGTKGKVCGFGGREPDLPGNILESPITVPPGRTLNFPGPRRCARSSQWTAEYFIRFCFCLWLQNQTLTTFFLRSSFSAMAAIFSDEGRG